MAVRPTVKTVADEQLELDWVPAATPSTTDFVCWLWAAFPPRNGRLNIARIAEALEISPTTLRRWIAEDEPKLLRQQVVRMHQRAILRGRGTYLWPALDEASRRRSELAYATAKRNDELIRTEPDRIAPTWKKNGTLDKRWVYVVHWPRAHAYGVAVVTHHKSSARVLRHGEILDAIEVPNKYAAIALKQEILARVDEHRCITPKHLVPTGHTETWRETGGPTTIRRPLEVAVVRFAGLEADRTVVEDLQVRFPLARVAEHVVDSAATACAALTLPVDVVVLASTGWTKKTWGSARRPWPGGRWFVGGRRPRAAGMSLGELVNGVGSAGGFRAPLVVVAAGHANVGRGQLRTLGGDTSRVLLQIAGRRGAAELIELEELIQRYDHDREEPRRAARGLLRYVPA
ncbi:hypothetical protein [Nocardioides limicola]|uniref:hypothetical protein n=1 Tax=Nocardioides limicola TaxID=2803368 RepID=UPI00193C43E5|nr:hypothetical protein [Nocardioides sp. DJM-14]